MFIFKLSSWVDKYDPYWYARLMSLKTAYLAIGLFFANLLIQPPMAVLVMILSAAGAIAAEMPTINDIDKKDLIYFGFLILVSITVGLFSSYVYLKGWFIIVVVGWTFILYSLLKKKPELFTLVSILLLLALISIEGINTGNFFEIINLLEFVVQFSIITFWLHKLFPYLYHKIWLSSILRSLESIQLTLMEQCLAPNMSLINHLITADRSLQLLIKKPYSNLAREFTDLISKYQYYICSLGISNTKDELSQMADDFNFLHSAICSKKEMLLNPQNEIPDNLAYHKNQYQLICNHWNMLCKHVNN